VKLSQFKVIEWCWVLVDPAKTWCHGLIPKEFVQQRPPFDSKGILRSLHEQLTLDVPYYHNCLWAFSMRSWSNEFSSQMCKCKTSRILSLSLFLYIFFSNHEHVQVPFQNPNSRKINLSLIHMGFIGLVTWSGVRGLWKKGSERLKECLRVILSKNLKSVACTLIHFNSWLGLYFLCLIHESL